MGTTETLRTDVGAELRRLAMAEVEDQINDPKREVSGDVPVRLDFDNGTHTDVWVKFRLLPGGRWEWVTTDA